MPDLIGRFRLNTPAQSPYFIERKNAEKLPCQRRAAGAAQAFGGSFNSVYQIGGFTMNIRDFSYMDIYEMSLQSKQRIRNAIPKDQITDATRQAWAFED